MKKALKVIFGVIGTILILLALMILFFMYQMNWKRTKIAEFENSENHYSVILQEIGSPFLFGPSDVRVILKDAKGTARDDLRTSIANDGGSLSSYNILVNWTASGAYITLRGQEQQDESFLLHYAPEDVVYNYTNLPGTDYTYNAMVLEPDLGLADGEWYYIYDIHATEKYIYTLGSVCKKTDTGYLFTPKYIVLDHNGLVKSECTLPENPERAKIFDDGEFIYIDKNTTGNGDAVTAGNTYPYELVYCDAAGKELKRIFIYEEAAENIIPGYVWYDSIGNIVLGEDKHVYILYWDWEYMDDVDLMSGTVSQVALDEDLPNACRNFCFFMDGKPVVELKDKLNKRFYHAVDVSTGTVSDAFTLLDTRVATPPDRTDVYGIGAYFHDGTGSGYDLVLSYDGGIAGFNRGDDAFKMIVEEKGSELYEYMMEDISFIDEEKFAVLYREGFAGSEQNHVVLFTAKCIK